jgi:prepilin-type N-terminal cleavage/methylation domain-containing protein
MVGNKGVSMLAAKRNNSGFTVIELMVTVAVGLVLLAIALPSFEGLRLRSAIRGAGEQSLGFWNQARLEAAKRNQMVKVGVVEASGDFCLGAATTADPADGVACDCFETDDTQATYCDVARFPGDGNQAEWKGVTLSATAPTLGSDLDGLAVIEPKRTALTDPDAAGTISLMGAPGNFSYKLNMHVDRFGRAMLCESTTGAVHHLSDYGSRQCAD